MKKVKIIAEAGVNHNGDIKIAKMLIDKAYEIGADAIKFQTFKAMNLVTPEAPKASYQVVNTKEESSQLQMLQALELADYEYIELFKYCQDKGIEFLSSPFDLESIESLHAMGVSLFKVPSGQLTDYPYLKRIAALKKEIILSTGMATLEEIEAALEVLLKGCPRISLLHCTSEYPAPFEEVNLNAMKTIGEKFGLEVGYSDHTLGIEVAIAAVAMGATIIEKHFTLDKHMKGPDHLASLEVGEFKQLITSIRNIELARGDGIKRPSPSELKNKERVRKSIVAIKPITKGEAFTTQNIGTKRPGSGISPMLWEAILLKKANRDYKENELISL